MGKFLVRKVTDNGNEGFSETLEYHVMHQANVNSNHNKFYLIEIQRHTDGRHRLFTHTTDGSVSQTSMRYATR